MKAKLKTRVRATFRRIDFEMKQIDGVDAFSTISEAMVAASDMGCSGYRSVEKDGAVWYVPCGDDEIAPESTDFASDGVHMVVIEGRHYDLMVEGGEPKWLAKITKVEKA
jgi:hypothetical protein